MIETLVDTGPLVAFYSTQDAWHEWVLEQITRYRRHGRQIIPLLSPGF
ncbi:MAG: hypothetical protein ABSF38_13330 [Verrucomicrobiota bacterium]|jgi:predicted nucleic acid-binding protein